MIIVTGGAGFIGSHLVTALGARGHSEILVVDRLGQGGKWRNLARAEIMGVIAPEALMPWLAAHAAQVEVIFHLGAISRTTETDGDRIARCNIMPTLDLFDWCRQQSVRLIYASSAATYGDGRQGFHDDQSAAYLARLTPLNAYAWSKHIADRRIIRLVESHGDLPPPRLPPQWAGLKFFNVYGAGEAHKGDQCSVISKMIPQVREGKTVPLFRSCHPDYADGEQRRDFVWVGDCIDMLLWFFDHPEVSGLFNAGSGEARSFNELAAAVFAALGKPPAICYIDPPAAVASAYQYFTQAPMAKLRACGYNTPSTPLEQGVALTVAALTQA